MRNVAFFKPLCLSLIFIFSSATTVAAELDAKQQLKTKLAMLASYQASFTQQVVDIENTLLQQANGRLVLQQPNKLYWELYAPNESVLLADGQNIWNVDSFLEQVVVYKADSALENNPLILLTDPNSDKWLEYNVRQSNQQFIITPTTLDGGIESLKLVFDGNTLIELESQDSQQQTSLLKFTDIQQNQTVASDTFIFVKPQGYELDDQR